MSIFPGRMRRGLPLVLFLGALAAAFWRAPYPVPPALAEPPAATPSSLPPHFSSETLPAGGSLPAMPSLSRLPDGRIAAAWSAGNLATDGERAIWFSVLGQDGWRAPVIIASRESTAGATFAYVGRIGSPVLHAEGGWLHLWYASDAGRFGASLNHSVSTNGGTNWTQAERLPTGMLASGSLQLGAAPLPLQDGGLALPISRQFNTGDGEYLRLAPTGEIIDQMRLAAPVLNLPSAVVPDEPRAMALLRLQSGRLLLIGHPENAPGALGTWLSADQGKTWQASRRLENPGDSAADFSDPALQLGSGGLIHLVHGWRRQGIKHLSFSEAWLDGALP